MIAATNHNQIARTPPSSCLSIGRPAIPPVGRAAAINDPEQAPSLPAGGRSLMGGCASRRQTRAQGGVLTLHRNRAIRPTRHFNQRQRSSGTALGLRWGLYRTTCAVGTTGREKASGDDTLEDLEGEARALASKIAAKKAAMKATA